MPAPTPLNSIELYLAKIAGETVTLPAAPRDWLETYLAKIAGESVTLPASPLNRIELYLAKIAGQTVTLPAKPLSRIELYLAAWAGQTVMLPEKPLSRLELYLAEIVAQNPPAYSLVSYVTFNGSTWIQTGVTIDDACEIEASFKPTSVLSTNCVYRFTITGNLTSCAAYWTSGGPMRSYFATATKTADCAADLWHVVINRREGFTVDGLFQSYPTIADFVCPYPLRIGTRVSSSGGIGTEKYIGDMDTFRIRKAGTDLINYHAAVRNSDNVYGFWDDVSESFITPESGTLTGPT